MLVASGRQPHHAQVIVSADVDLVRCTKPLRKEAGSADEPDGSALVGGKALFDGRMQQVI